MSQEGDPTVSTLSEVPLETVEESTQDDSATENQDQVSSAENESGAAENEEQKPPSVNVQFDTKMNLFYSAKPGRYEKAMDDIQKTCVAEEDGQIRGGWLLMEVDHWDTETEKFVVLTDESIITVRYDFVPMKVYKAKKLFIKDVDTIQCGPFTYPRFSLCRLTSDAKKRQYEGVRVMWNNGEEPTISQRWSASTRSMPWQTFTFHPLFTNALIPHYFDVKNFLSMLVTAVNEAYTRHDIDKTLTVKTEPIQQNVYVGLISQFHNQSFLGMSKERGGYSF